jgi:putative tryptophan/tyrosine transport system substrate-binding protein
MEKHTIPTALRFAWMLLLALSMNGCGEREDQDIPVIGFADAFEDETLSLARDGFFQALEDNGFSEEQQNLKVIQRNAQGDIPALSQIMNYFIAQKVTLIAANPTITTITAVQKTADIPVFMMVAGTPENMQLTDKEGKAPGNLFGVAETLDYIDTSFLMIASLISPKNAQLKIGMIYNQAEPQSVSALERIQSVAKSNNMEVIAMPVNSSADAQMVTQALLSKGIDAFFANPDNTVFASFETILKNCQGKGVPVFSSEAGLVSRGAVAAFGADIYQWGYQSGVQAAQFLKSGQTEGLSIEIVKVRKRVFNKAAAEAFGITMPEGFDAL